jgi:amino acid permease
MAHITNAVILISIVSTGSISGYGGSRMLMGLAHVRMNHKVGIIVTARLPHLRETSTQTMC